LGIDITLSATYSSLPHHAIQSCTAQYCSLLASYQHMVPCACIPTIHCSMSNIHMSPTNCVKQGLWSLGGW